ncbi:tRNA (guanosine(46)-N7)-methyltransferase TrmB [uncultured Dysosmobacter sp.]|uniref:tRNA (guanosine(46)-N7)-methyltransferase TrmB n=1 Tax=uncultured Dysosmobacter sp. TaxID=2591384 RepID=UPI00262DF2E9|nr:tRNA (guanosine(46)-N7)-methyltransferase TrmB [uncultured Dysosmobacter sp.]
MRMRKKKNLVPRMERCGDRLIRDPYDHQGHWRDLMPSARELRLELGCGKGRFTAGTAEAEPGVLFIAVEMVPDAMVVAMERCVRAGLTNVFFIDANADQLPSFFAPGEIDRIYLNFSDPWPGNRHAKRRLTHGNFLKLYRQVLKMGGQIHFKTDNQPLFEFSVEEIPQFGFTLSEVTRDLHGNGPVGVMTDYEAKFYEQGLPINRLVATMVPWEEPFPKDIRRVKSRWLDVFAADVSEADLGQHVLADGNYLWHIFSWKLVSCLEGDGAQQALAEAAGDIYLFYYKYPPAGVPRIQPLTREDALGLARRQAEEYPSLDGMDWYLVDKDFTWTYVHTHESECGPYFCKAAQAYSPFT